jgi:hypothetical protein
VTALFPAISTGLKQSTATPEGLGNLFGIMGAQRDLHAMHGDPKFAFAQQGRAAGNDVLSVIFGSPDVSRAVVDQAQKFSGVSSNILKKLLPVLAGILISGMMSGRSGKSAPSGAPASPDAGGALGDILGQIFGRGMPGSPDASPGPRPQMPLPGGQSFPAPTGAPGGDLLGSILRELEQGIREGRIKPVIIDGGTVNIPMPGGQAGPAPSGPQVPGGDILGQILRDMLGGATGGGPMGGGPARAPQERAGPSPQVKELSDLSKKLGAAGGVGAAVFGDRFEHGREVDQGHLDNIQSVFDQFFGAKRR